MNVIDIIIVMLLIMSSIVGWKKGVIKETVSLIGIILVFVISFSFKEQLGNILCKFLPFFNFGGNLEGMVSLNILMYQFIAFFIIYSILYGIYALILKLSGILQKVINITLILALPSKLAGAVVGLVKGYIVTFVVMIILLIPFKNIDIFRNSTLINKITNNTPILSTYTKDINNTVSDIYKLGENLTTKKLTVNEANIQTIDTMLKYDIVSKKTIEQLIILDKLKTVKGLDKILSKY